MPLALPLRAGERREVQLRDRLVDEPALVLARQRLARDLLGREDREVGDLGADLLDRPPRLGLDVTACLLEQLLAPLLADGDGVGLLLLAGLARPRDDVVGLLARGRQALAV